LPVELIESCGCGPIIDFPPVKGRRIGVPVMRRDSVEPNVPSVLHTSVVSVLSPAPAVRSPEERPLEFHRIASAADPATVRPLVSPACRPILAGWIDAQI
jgi:hypothetical protein